MRNVLILSIALLLMLNFGSALSQVDDDYAYAYIGLTPDGQAQLVLNDATNTDLPTVLQILAVPDGNRIFGFSPNNLWTVLILPSPETNVSPDTIQLLNIYTGEIRDVGTINSLTFIKWSFGSQFIAYLASDENDTEVYVYSLQQDILINITDDVYEQETLAWSPDSTELVTSFLDCTDDNCVSLSIQLFNASTNRQEASIAVNAFLQFYLPICQLDVSSEATYVSFVSACAYDVPGVPKDVYVWDIALNNISPVTEFDTPLFNVPTLGVLNSKYDTFWFDDETLLVGVTNLFNGTPESQILVYDSSQPLNVSISTRTFRELTRNLVTSDLAYRSFTGSEFSPQDMRIDLARFENNSLNVLATLPAGCNLSWSPDGEWLAYTTHGLPFTSCGQPEQGIMLYNRIRGEFTEIDISEYTGGIIPVGWVVAQS